MAVQVLIITPVRSFGELIQQALHDFRAAAAFLGRTFMYGVAALGNRGGDHVAELLQIQLRQVLEQLGCHKPSDLPNFRPLI